MIFIIIPNLSFIYFFHLMLQDFLKTLIAASKPHIFETLFRANLNFYDYFQN
jgi:hypothetical protein